MRSISKWLVVLVVAVAGCGSDRDETQTAYDENQEMQTSDAEERLDTEESPSDLSAPETQPEPQSPGTGTEPGGTSMGPGQSRMGNQYGQTGSPYGQGQMGSGQGQTGQGQFGSGTQSQFGSGQGQSGMGQTGQRGTMGGAGATGSGSTGSTAGTGSDALCEGITQPEVCPLQPGSVRRAENIDEGVLLRLREEAAVTQEQLERRIRCYEARATTQTAQADTQQNCAFALPGVTSNVSSEEGTVIIRMTTTSRDQVPQLRQQARQLARRPNPSR